MKKIPLLCLIPLFLILAVLFFIDEPLEEAFEGEGQSSTKVTNKIREWGQFELVVGKTGSLDGGFEPIYAEPNEESTIIGKLEFNCAIFPADEQNEEDWVCVDLKQKGLGYVKREAVDIESVSFHSEDFIRQALIEKAYSYLGLKFVRYGKSLTEGIDCSNFVSQIYATQDITISNRPKEQRDQGTVVEKKEMHPGDIIYYDKANNGTGHVGMYLGDGFIINSSGHSGKNYPEGGVRIVKLLYPDRTSYQVVQYIQETEER